jgi:hypothetical protein
MGARAAAEAYAKRYLIKNSSPPVLCSTGGMVAWAMRPHRCDLTDRVPIVRELLNLDETEQAF